MKKFLKNEKGMELIQSLGVAAVAIVLISVLYTGLNGSFNTWLGSFDSSVNGLLGEFSIQTSSCEGGSHTEVILNAYEGYTGDVYCSVCGNKLRYGTYIEYGITYDADGGTMPEGYSTKYTVISGDITLPTPTRDGYVFKGWTGSNGSTPQTTVTIPTGSTGHKTYTAVWEGLASGLYETGTTNLLKSWEQLIADGDITVSGTSVTGSNKTSLAGDLVIPNSITSIGDDVFEYCSKLTSVAIPNSVTSIGSYAFWNCYRLTNITIPNSVTNIGNSAFSGCSGLTIVTIPSSVTSIGGSVFARCSGLAGIIVDTNNANYSSGNGILYNKDKTRLIEYPAGKSGAFTIPNSVTSIGDNAFEYCSGLTSITIPNSVTHIGTSAFSSCSGLTSVTIPDSVTRISMYAFNSCSALTSVYHEHTTTPTWFSYAFNKFSGNPTTFYFKNSTVASAFTTDYYDPSFGTISTDYNW